MSKISSKELLGVIISLTCTLFPLFGTNLIINTGNNSTIICILIGYIIGFIPISLIIYISKFLDNKNIFELNKEKFKFFGHIINLILFLGVIFIGLLLSWKIVDFTISNLLSQTNAWAIAIVLFPIMAYAVIKGQEVINRSTFILIIILLIMLIFSTAFLIPNVKLDNFLPLFNISKIDFIKCSFYYMTLSVFPLISTLSIKQNDIVDKENFKKTIIIGYSISTLIILIFNFLIIGIYGAKFASILSFPDYYLFKNINAFDFIQRTENIISSTVYIASYGGTCFLIYFAHKYIIDTLKIKKKKIINFIIILLAVGIPLISIYLFQNYYINDIILKYPYFSSIILIGLILNFILLLFSSKRKRN